MIKYVGLTGGIGSGKSTVGAIFSVLGVPVYNADNEARLLSNSNPVVIEGLKSLLGNGIYKDGVLQRAHMAQIVFNNNALLQKVNEIIHPVVEEHFKRWAAQFPDSQYVVKEAAILIENGGYKKLDHLIVVVAPEMLRIARVMKRDGVSEQLVKDRIKNQWTDQMKMQYAQSMITADDQTLVIPQVIAIHNQLINQ